MGRIAFVLFILLLLSFNSFAQETPPFAQISSVDFRGSGCDAESARVALTSDLSYLSVLYDRFSVSIGQGSENPTAKNAVKNCAVVVKIEVPAGWSFKFETVEYAGFVSLPTNEFQATQRMSAFTRDGSRGRDFQQNIMNGPLSDSFRSVYVNPSQTPAIGIFSERAVGGRILGPPGRGGGRLVPPMQPPSGPGRPQLPPGLARRFKQRVGDMMDCQEQNQQTVLVLRSAIMIRNLNPRSQNNSLASIAIDSADASVQRLKLNWHKCQVE